MGTFLCRPCKSPVMHSNFSTIFSFRVAKSFNFTIGVSHCQPCNNMNYLKRLFGIHQQSIFSKPRLSSHYTATTKVSSMIWTTRHNLFTLALYRHCAKAYPTKTLHWMLNPFTALLHKDQNIKLLNTCFIFNVEGHRQKNCLKLARVTTKLPHLRRNWHVS